MKITCGLGMILGFGFGLFAPRFVDAAATDGSDGEVAYRKTIEARAEKIVASLGLTDTNQIARVRILVAGQYFELNRIHTERDARANSSSPAATAEGRAEAQSRLDQLHAEFLARLAKELTSEQVEGVKDGMTYGVAPLTYGVYLKMYPDLTEVQKAQLRTWLNEAREIAMDAGTAKEKHAVFGKYKGKINNYLAKAGYDAKKAEANLRKPAETKPQQNQ